MAEGGLFEITQEVSVLLPTLPVEDLSRYIHRSFIFHSPFVQLAISFFVLTIVFFIFQFRITENAQNGRTSSPSLFSGIRLLGGLKALFLAMTVFLCIQLLAPPFLPSSLPYTHLPLEGVSAVSKGSRLHFMYTVKNTSTEVLREVYFTSDLYPNISIIPDTLIVYTYGGLGRVHIPFVTERDLLVLAGELQPGDSFIVQFEAYIHEQASRQFDQELLITSSGGNERISKTIYLNDDSYEY
ncbi:MAG: hypothetical protein O3B64_01165 [bacterium]|nr:hypothetical protein [bacterium]